MSSALTYVGTPYRYGGASSSGMDCSGLVYAVYRDLVAAAVPRTVKDLFAVGQTVDGPLSAGDLVLLRRGRTAYPMWAFIRETATSFIPPLKDRRPESYFPR
ncbi:MAG: C40 family peptidase [Candidatus Competibacteraceae bacterium]|nr:C40 family peptidase [Candidatus Competibacteraceae bacterium]